MPKSSWSICVSGTIRVPTKRFCLPWFPRFDFFFHSTPSSPLENYSTTKLSDSPWNAWTPPERDRWSLRSLRCLDIDVDFFLSLPLSLFFFFSLEKRKTRYSEVHSWTGTEDYAACRERRVYPFNRAVDGEGNRVRGSVTRSRFSKCIAVKPNYMGEIIRKEEG